MTAQDTQIANDGSVDLLCIDACTSQIDVAVAVKCDLVGLDYAVMLSDALSEVDIDFGRGVDSKVDLRRVMCECIGHGGFAEFDTAT
ncbi:hypothetical protein D3C81_1933300 [compost metagenome]